MTAGARNDLEIPRELLPRDGRFGCGPSKIRPEQIRALVDRSRDVLGTSQSGMRRTLRLLEVARHADVIAAAREAAVRTVEHDPTLATLPGLAHAVDALVRDDSAEYLEKA